MKYKYIIRVKNDEFHEEVFKDLVWYVLGEKNLYDILKYIIECFIMDGEIVTIERSELDEQE